MAGDVWLLGKMSKVRTDPFAFEMVFACLAKTEVSRQTVLWINCVWTPALTCVLSPRERISAITRFVFLINKLANPVADFSQNAGNVSLSLSLLQEGRGEDER
jgi:hypothetical protein